MRRHDRGVVDPGWPGRLVVAVFLGLVVGALPPPAWAQSCRPSTFEAGDEGWTHFSLSGAADTWHRAAGSCDDSFVFPSTAFVSNGNLGPGCTQNSHFEESRLLSPPILLPPSGPIRLLFDASSYDEGGTCVSIGVYDAKDVGISTDGGETYTRLNPCFTFLTHVFNPNIVHHEFDISDFAGQTVQVVFEYNTWDAGAGYYFAVDNVRIETGDADLDGVGDECDCAPLSATAWAIPGEVSDLAMTLVPPAPSGDIELTWTSPTGGDPAEMVYDVVRSSDKATFNSAAATCLETDDGPNTTTADASTPAVGHAYYYQVIAEHQCGRGSAGAGSGGAPRLVRDCP